MELFYLRAAERLLIVVSGLICIILGYGLFRLSYARVERADTELVAKGAGFELTLRHVWPGVFFAAFGMVILVTSILTQLKTPGSASPVGSDQSYNYQGSGLPPEDSKIRAIGAISAIGTLLAIEPSSCKDNNPQRVTAISRLATAQIDLVDVAYGQGSYDKFTDIVSKSRNATEFATLSKRDKQFFEELRTTLLR